MSYVYKEIDLYPTDLEFAVFSTEEIKKLSVVKVITSLTFDPLGRPLPGGLYDSRMGTFGKTMDSCGTCLSMAYCPGHMGHIELNALVYNPFFTKVIYDILKVSCLDCYKLQLTEHVINILQMQLALVDAGYVIEAQEMEIFKSEMVASTDTTIKVEKGAKPKTTLMHPKILQMHELLAKGKKESLNATKTSCAIRTSIVSAAMQKSLARRCIHCKNQLKNVRNSYRKLVMILPKEKGKKKGTITKVILADECRTFLRSIYETHPELIRELFPILKSSQEKHPMDIFFMNIIPVIPPKARPANVLLNQISDHAQTVTYKSILEANSILRLIFKSIKTDGQDLQDDMKSVYDRSRGTTAYEKMYFAWQELQSAIDVLLDVTNVRNADNKIGLKQIVEKKEGIIRKHMMGKRVNYACRTVITPDPNINVEEIGIPDIFARKLSYPVAVTSWNVQELRKMIMNGPDVHPGANYIEDDKGHKILIPAENASKRESLAKLLLTNPENGIKTVHRHVLNGDIMLLNRQPTLHRPSIMAHKARILHGEKTFRLHYSNCKSYNADFDGDEMNAHLPQSEVARSEAYNLVNVASQYLVPKDGTPLGGLIQDHVISGVKLSLRGRFFNREDYQQLVFHGLAHIKGDIKLLPPTIIKPNALWSGKQILSTIILNIIPEGYPAINLRSNSKIAARFWKTSTGKEGFVTIPQLCENVVVIRGGELLTGVLDKQQYGATEYGLVHCMYELYGGHTSTALLTAFTKLFTNFLQREGFTLGVHDILVTAPADRQRREIIEECRTIGNEAVAAALEMDDVPTADVIAENMEEAYIKDPKFRVILDRKFKSYLDQYTNKINQACLPGGLISRFPSNNLQLMVLSGAKGSMVNTMQISCLLGQIELEGKRPPLMISGKSLPSFTASETSPKSGGFIDGRFMTGIQPQEFFFHCMAGREGLIDTAVKTSRSGYLQRCLIKHLEGLSVNYDMTVRDSDNSVVQFMYGEDGMDILKSRFFNEKSLNFLNENADAVLHGNDFEKIKDNDSLNSIHHYGKKLKSWRKKHGTSNSKFRCSSFQKFSEELRGEIEVTNANKINPKTGRLNIDEKIIKLWSKADSEKKDRYRKKYSKCPDPVISKFKPDNYYGSVSEYVENLMQTYIERNPNAKDKLRDIMYVKNIKSLAAAGEPVGLLAAQSIGEPSTQMTLNTFHFAGRGEMNVTLGIPRLREILMLASSNIKTPSMDIPFKANQVKNADKLRVKLNRVTLADVLQFISVKTELVVKPSRGHQYKLHFQFLPRDAYQDDLCVKPKQITKFMSTSFIKIFFRAIARSAKNKNSIIDMGDEKPTKDADDALDEGDDIETRAEKSKKTVNQAGDSSDDDGGDDDDAIGVRLKNKKQDEKEYDDPDDEEEIQDANDDEHATDDFLDDAGEAENGANDDEMAEKVMEHDMVKSYIYDKDNHAWCELTFHLPVIMKKPDLTTILKELAKKSVIYEVSEIKRAITYKNNDDLFLKTDGINIKEMFKYNKVLDLNRLYCNDIHNIARTYGIEAAGKVIVKEVQNVFKVYGITVDPRHLVLIADYMTFDGTFKPLSRKGMEFSPSPMQQMTYESSLQFLKAAAVYGRHDELNSPSSRIMVGLPVKNGTGSFSLLTKLS